MATVFHGDQARGVASRIVFGEEASTYGTAAEVDEGHELPLTSDAIQNNINTFESELIRTDRSVANIREGNYRPDGDINTELIPSNVPTLIKHALGVYASSTKVVGSSTATVDDQYDHVLYGSETTESIAADFGGAGGLQPAARKVSSGETAAYSLTFEKQFEFPGAANPEVSLLYTGARINRWSLTVPTEGIVGCSFGFLGANETLYKGSAGAFHFDSYTAATSAPETLGLSPFTSFQTSIELGTAGGTGYSALDKVQSFDFTLENGLNGDNFILGQRARANLLEGRRRITGSLQMLFLSDDEFYEFFLDSATNPKALKITFSQDGTSTTNTAQVVIELDYVKFVGSPATPTIPGEGPISLNIPFQVYKGSSSTSDPDKRDIVVTVRNGQSRI